MESFRRYGVHFAVVFFVLASYEIFALIVSFETDKCKVHNFPFDLNKWLTIISLIGIAHKAIWATFSVVCCGTSSLGTDVFTPSDVSQRDDKEKPRLKYSFINIGTILSSMIFGIPLSVFWVYGVIMINDVYQICDSQLLVWTTIITLGVMGIEWLVQILFLVGLVIIALFCDK